MAATPAAIAQMLDVQRDERMISYLPLAHAFERAAVEMMSFQIGSHIFFAESLDTFVKDIQRARPTIFISVPRLWLKFQLGVFQKMPEKKLRTLLKIPIIAGIVKKKILTGLGLDQVRYAITGSAPVPAELVQWYRDLGLELLEGYAMTEDFRYSHFSVPGKMRPGYVGNPLPGVEVRLSDEKEVLITSPGCMKSYYKEPELTAASFTPDGYFKTGDRGERDAEGRLKITGRIKELFKSSKGKYIAPAPIENLLNAHSHIELSCVTGVGLAQPLAIVQLAEALRKELSAGAGDRAAIDAGLRSLLDPTMKLKRSMIDDHYGPHLPGWSEGSSQVVWPS